MRISRSNKNYYHHHPNLRLYRSRVSLNLTLPFGTVVLLFDIGVEEVDVAVFTILFRLNMSEASRIMSLYFDEEGTADADFAGPPRADKFPAFNAARSIASARRRADSELAFEFCLPWHPACCILKDKADEATSPVPDDASDVTCAAPFVPSLILRFVVGVDFLAD